MANTQTPFHPDHSSHITYIQHPQPNNNFVQQPSFNTNYMQQPMQNPEDISDSTTALDMALELMSKEFQLNNITPTNNNQRSSSNPCYSQIAQSGMNIDQDRQMLMVDDNVGNHFRENAVENARHLVGQNAVQNQGTQNVGNQNGLSIVLEIANHYRNGNVETTPAEGNGNGINGNPIRCYKAKPRKQDAAYLQQQLQIAQEEEAGIQSTQEEFDFMAAASAYEETERENANYTLENNLQQASTSEEQYTKLLEPIPEPHQVPQNDCNVISEVSSVEQGGGTVEQHPPTVSKKKSTVSSLLEEKKKLKSDFKIREDELLDKQIQLENKIKELDNILVKTEKHDPPAVYDSEETLQLAQESRLKMKRLNKEIKPANYTKINHLSRVFVSQTAKSREELYFSNTSKSANVSKSFSIPNEEFSDDTTPSAARKFLNESYAHQEIHKIVKDEMFPNVNQVDARVQNFEIEFLKEAAKFVRDFKSLAKEADESIAKQKALELEIERLLREVASQDIMSIVQNPSVVDTSNL
ncbi:hypothetical protein Tco_1255595 [Tanacetum coccineum]